jgi:sugar/nucleoside kinase (ribokinase family)
VADLQKWGAMRIGCLGMATLDTLLFTQRPVYAHDEVTPVEEVVVSPGGKGIVSTAAMHRCGMETVPFALLGRRSELGPLLAAFDDRYLLPLLDADSRTWITVSEEHRVVTFIARGALAKADEETALTALRRFIEEIDALYITVEHAQVLRLALELALQRDLRIALNPSVPMIDQLGSEDPDLLARLVSNSSIVLCNDWEAPRVLRVLGKSSWSELGESSLREVVITSGASGGNFSLAPFESWEHFDATPVSHPRSVVGAGDTFNGAYLASRLSGGTPAESCRRGADLAALKVGHRGSMLPADEPAAAS